MTRKALTKTFLDTVPVLTGYLFLGIGFGILLNEKGYGVPWAAAMALAMFAGSGQYLAVELLATHASLVTTAIATLLLNARHLFYGLSMLDRYKDMGLKRLYLIFGLCDETFSINSSLEIPSTPHICSPIRL